MRMCMANSPIPALLRNKEDNMKKFIAVILALVMGACLPAGRL
jgi:hypothetical protein